MFKVIKIENEQETTVWTDKKLDNAMYEAIGYCSETYQIRIVDDMNRIMWQG